MLMIGLFAWWYGRGWGGQIRRIKATLVRVNDAFSVPLLIKTWFAPFRQISADETGRTIGEKFSAMISRGLSRVIGAVMRTFMIVFGCIVMLLLLVLSLVRFVLWPLMPLMPVAGAVVMMKIGIPWK